MGVFIPDPSRPHLRYPWQFVREAALKRWNMTMARPRDIEPAHKHLIAQVTLAKADVIGRLESGNRDWEGLRKAVATYIDFQTGADVLSGQTPLDSP